ncbi:TPA: 3-deoxy-7-phosphoheptulonate synthase [Candidatus Galligastranaerophilus intestinavium]|uniref:3-deoxy-7-phosphoheptulonate synthase n=1 Tax=Candidatus Galligastranaerophilus intestinavium TaxID=2840836 RepID=A0A9D1FHZ3_9BACT|nr:3-deoxy-7-phosphoheptulonate synthase [Candidatus Galligastranaerophilus intestinavium]
MIVVMEPKATEDQINKVVDYIQSKGLRVNINRGEHLTVVAVLGDKSKLNPTSINAIDGVHEIKIIQEPYKLVSRSTKEEDTIIEFKNGVKIGGLERPVIMAGPCSVEKDYEGLLKVAQAAREMGCQFLRGGAFKPRTSPYDFQGLEEKGLEYLAQARKDTGLLVVTEIMDTMDIPLVSKYADVLQVGARNMQNFKMLKALGKIDKPVMIKRGPAATIREFLLAAEYVVYNGNPNVILCERGIKGIDNDFTRNTLDIAAVPIIRKYSHLPIIVDPSHGTGKRYLIEPMGKAALIAGAHGLMIEVHHDPDHASSDGAQSLSIEQFKDVAKRLNKLIGRIDYDNKNL